MLGLNRLIEMDGILDVRLIQVLIHTNSKA